MDVREKLVELLDDCVYENVLTDDPYDGFEVKCGNIADHLIAHGVTVQEWISVKDRLPDMDEKCLLCMENRITKYRWVTIGYFHTNYDEYVTHWQLMPQPPKGE